MHELPIAQNLLSLVLEHAEKNGGGRVVGVHLVVGELSSIVDDSLQFYWEIITAGSAAEGSQLHFRRLPMRLRCRDCETTFEPANLEYRCSACGSRRVGVEGGDDLRLEAIDLEPDEPPGASEET
ncbi:MAG: hydrogenase maturation nickel metallochaperone HypA [Candidatus Eisenbacteria bacterium]|nr:hydrogenase maturation nickel metallochaperone HypA [Candidatus Eisenbacteria bacterium]